ncbi:uncharacterized protein LOC108183760 [Tachysurus ichikawai]
MKTPNPLTRRHLLSQVAGLYDPIGLVTPAKQKGAILVRKAFQEAGGGSLTQQTWDKELSIDLREEAIKLFEEWNTDQQIEVRLVESKAKLTPLDQKGDAVKAEICAAVFAVRLRRYFEKHGRMEVERWFHLVDSQTVLRAIERDSYGYQTFFANRIGEIQKSGQVSDWWWIPGDVNIADIITRGGTPENLCEESEWQKGPQFLRLPVEEWPVKSAAEIVADARERVSKLQRKTFSAVLTRAQTKKELRETVKRKLEDYVPRGTPSDLVVKKLINVEKSSNLGKLVRVIGWVWHGIKKMVKMEEPKPEEWKTRIDAKKWDQTGCADCKRARGCTKRALSGSSERCDFSRHYS